jgi:hypothetical protein
VNIYGNLKGDILVPSSIVDSLFGTNSASASTAGTAAGGSINSDINITNNIDLSAVSGDATVQGNYKAGDATSGDATTNLTVFNLTGQEVIAKNSLLVFVNVLGKWVGMIINAPVGSTAAAFSGGASASSAGGGQPTGDYSDEVNITNNIKVAANSGDATVKDNYKAGSATSGNATAGANVLNLVHSSFNLDDWFGVLFINVLGSWLGNFGIAPAATTPDPAAGGHGGGLPDSTVKAVKVFRLNDTTRLKPAAANPAPAPTTDHSQPLTNVETVSATQPEPAAGNVLAAHDDTSMPTLPQSVGTQDTASVVAMLIGLALLLALGIIALRRRSTGRRASAMG